MGVKAKTVTGARCKLYINGKLAGVFSNVSFGVTYDVQPVYILGRHNAAEIVYTGMNTVDVQATGFRVTDNGPFEIGSLPQLQELIDHEDIVLSMIDRQDPTKSIMTVTGVRPVSFNSSGASRALVDMNMSFIGTTFSDESGPQEDAGAVDFG